MPRERGCKFLDDGLGDAIERDHDAISLPTLAQAVRLADSRITARLPSVW